MTVATLYDRIEIAILINRAPSDEVNLLHARWCELTNTGVEPKYYLTQAIESVGEYDNTTLVNLTLTRNLKVYIDTVHYGLDDPLVRMTFCKSARDFAIMEECYNIIMELISDE